MSALLNTKNLVYF